MTYYSMYIELLVFYFVYLTACPRFYADSWLIQGPRNPKILPCSWGGTLKNDIAISQRKYCLYASKTDATPLDPSLKLHQYGSEPFKDIIAYKRLIGKLAHLNNTRPDITLATQ